jgi:ABC-2 type transport system ATP-binding protein
MLTCLVGPTSGEAWVNGLQVGRQDTDIRRSVGILTETPGLYDRLSAEKNLTIFARLYEVKDVPGQVAKYLRMLGLWDRRDDLAGNFSKGMKQKLAICRALLHEPRVLFLDEPTSGLDPEAAKLVHDFIAELKAEGRTIFMCTHNLDEADRLCDQVGVMKQRLLVVDTPQNLRQRLYGRKVVFHLRQADARLVDLVQALPFARDVQAVELASGGKIVVGLDDPEAQNPVIVRRLVEAGADVQFVGEIRHSLEDVYLSLIQAAQSPAESGRAQGNRGE